MAIKKEIEDENCPECGNSATITTSRIEGFWDGDELECDECEMHGVVSINEDGSWLALWVYPEAAYNQLESKT